MSTAGRNGGRMTHRKRTVSTASLVALLAVVLSAGCAIGPTVTGNFDRTISVTTPIRLERANASGDVTITGTGDGKVHVHGEVRSSGLGFGSPQDRLNEIVS